MNIWNRVLVGLLGAVSALALVIAIAVYNTEGEIRGHLDKVEAHAKAAAITLPVYDPAKLSGLPEPVQRYFRFTFVEPHQASALVRFDMEGDFRRPGADVFEPTTAEQTLSVGSPDFVFSATTPILPGVWARVFDAFSNSEMVMKAKIMALFTVVDERETPELNRISLRRWLLETPMFPAALLPGGQVRWQAIDDQRARAIVSSGDFSASLIATFRGDGSLLSFDAEQDGDLNTPYHGSGEQVLREDYRLVSGMMIPHGFTISRVAEGNVYPFWKGKVTAIGFDNS